jgi:hypothetical protein
MAITAAVKEAGLVAVESYEAKSPDYKAVVQRLKQGKSTVRRPYGLQPCSNSPGCIILGLGDHQQKTVGVYAL